MKAVNLSEQIRQRAVRDYVQPALESHRSTVTIPVRELKQKLEAEGFPRNHTPQFCSALQAQSFLRQHGLILESIEGPPSGQSTTVVFHMRFQRAGQSSGEAPASVSVEEDPHERAVRFVNSLKGLLKNELAGYGGAEGFMRWVRSEDEA